MYIFHNTTMTHLKKCHRNIVTLHPPQPDDGRRALSGDIYEGEPSSNSSGLYLAGGLASLLGLLGADGGVAGGGLGVVGPASLAGVGSSLQLSTRASLGLSGNESRFRVSRIVGLDPGVRNGVSDPWAGGLLSSVARLEPRWCRMPMGGVVVAGEGNCGGGGSW